jgi:hypothetical protein
MMAHPRMGGASHGPPPRRRVEQGPHGRGEWVSPCATAWPRPGRAPATTGQPAAWASSTAMPMLSPIAGQTARSAAR